MIGLDLFSYRDRVIVWIDFVGIGDLVLQSLIAVIV